MENRERIRFALGKERRFYDNQRKQKNRHTGIFFRMADSKNPGRLCMYEKSVSLSSGEPGIIGAGCGGRYRILVPFFSPPFSHGLKLRWIPSLLKNAVLSYAAASAILLSVLAFRMA